MNWLKTLLLMVIFGYLCEPLIGNEPLKIHLFHKDEKRGHGQDNRILSDALIALGHQVELTLSHHTNRGSSADINIFIEDIDPQAISQAPINWFIPNPEGEPQAQQLLNCIDLILCRTHEVERIFRSMNANTYFLGFASQDCRLESVEKDFSSCLHLEGGSAYKGTGAVIEAWDSSLTLPALTLVSQLNRTPLLQSNVKWIGLKLPTDELRLLQNRCAIHLCPSDTEGFGHSLMEALSTGAVLVTTDAPPMNEYITDPRCLVPYIAKTPHYLATRYFVNPNRLRETVQYLITLPLEELQSIGKRNRESYLKRVYAFSDNLNVLLETYLQMPNKRTTPNRPPALKFQAFDHPGYNASSVNLFALLPKDAKFERLKIKVLHALEDSWVSKEKARLMMDIIALTHPQVCVDVGSFTGSSVLPIAVSLRYLKSGLVYCVDAWSNIAATEYMPHHDPNYQWWSHLDMDQIHKQCLQLLHNWSVMNYCQVIRERSEYAVSQIDSIDFLHLDGNTSKKGSYLDTFLYVPKVKSGGYILLSNALTTIDHECSKIITLGYLDQHCRRLMQIDEGSTILFQKL